MIRKILIKLAGLIARLYIKYLAIFKPGRLMELDQKYLSETRDCNKCGDIYNEDKEVEEILCDEHLKKIERMFF